MGYAVLGIAAAPAGELLNFEVFKGQWIGSGAFTYADGHRERAHCRATVKSYRGRPDRGGIDLACTSGKTNIAGNAYDVTLKGAKVSGSFHWPAFEITGAVSGKVTETSFDVVLRPQMLLYNLFSAHFVVTVTSNCTASATATIDAPVYVQKAAVSLHRC